MIQAHTKTDKNRQKPPTTLKDPPRQVKESFKSFRKVSAGLCVPLDCKRRLSRGPARDRFFDCAGRVVCKRRLASLQMDPDYTHFWVDVS
jgi:hypothetical protein